MKDEDCTLWERQPGESSQAFDAFSHYRDMGGERSIRAVAEKLHKSSQLLGRWSRTWFWVERCRAYDNELSRKAEAQAIRDLSSMRKRQIRLAMQMQEKALAALEALDATELDANEIVKLIVEGAKLEGGNRHEEAGIVPQVHVRYSNDGETTSSQLLRALLEDNSIRENGPQQAIQSNAGSVDA